MGPIETNANYPLSSEPAEGYSVDRAARSGKVILINALNRKYVRVTDDGYELVTEREDATKFDDHAEASIKAGKLVTAAKAQAASLEAMTA